MTLAESPPSAMQKKFRPLSPAILGSSAHRWIAAGITLLAVLVWAKSYVGCVVVDGESMRPTFQSGDVLLVDKRTYRSALPQRGDIVVSRFRSELLVKRVVGLPGETVEVVNGALRVNGAAMPESHPIEAGSLQVRPGELFEDRIAILGDNRAPSDNILFFAVVPTESVVGRSVLALRFRWGNVRLWRC